MVHNTKLEKDFARLLVTMSVEPNVGKLKDKLAFVWSTVLLVVELLQFLCILKDILPKEFVQL